MDDQSAPLRLLNNTSFTRQIYTARALYGKQLKMPQLTRNDIMAELEPLLKYYAERDRGIIADRVIECIFARQKFNKQNGFEAK